VAIFLTVPLVFIVTVGEIDLSFRRRGFLRLDVCADRAGKDSIQSSFCSRVTGPEQYWEPSSVSLVVYANLSSLIATLGMNFVLRGIILIFTEGKSIALTSLNDSWLFTAFSSEVFGVPIQYSGRRVYDLLDLSVQSASFCVHVQIGWRQPRQCVQMGIDVNACA